MSIAIDTECLDLNQIVVPTLKNVMKFLIEKSTDMRLFSSIPISTAALVCLECDMNGFTLHASADEDDIDWGQESFTAWELIYLGDSNGDLMMISHRLISTVMDKIGGFHV